MESDDEKFWFPAKTTGTGWGLPCRWQGWLVLIGYLILLFGGMHFIDPHTRTGICIGYLFGLTVIFILIVWTKGEKLS